MLTGSNRPPAGQTESAIDVERLSAALYYNLGVIPCDRGDIQKAKASIAVARKIEPDVVAKHEGAH